MNAEWNLRACADQCVVCGRKFSDREGLMSRLRFTPEGYLREDFCAACWPARTFVEGAEVSAWASRWCAPAPKAPEPLKKEAAESLLRELMETEEPSRRNAIFILAVMLERRRILVEKEVQWQPDGRKIRVYEHKQTGESFVVPDPQLRLREIEHVQRQVMDLLCIHAPNDTPQTAQNENPSQNEVKSPENAEKLTKKAPKSEKT